MPEINGITVPFMPVGGAEALKNKTAIPDTEKSGSGKFDKLFQEELNKVKFSGHALSRLESRNIDISPAELAKLNSAVEKAAQKGSKDALVMMDDRAFIVSIENRTVVTVLDKDKMDENVVTNIDSAVITK